MAGANIKIGVTSSEFKKQMKEVNNQLKLMQSECALATSKASAFGSKTDQLKAKQNALKNSIASQNQTISLYENRITSINSTITKQTAEQTKLSQKIKETTQKYKESCTQTGKNSEESKKLDEEIKKLNEEYKKNEKSMQSNQQELNNLKIRLNNTKASLTDNEKALKDLDKQLGTVKWDEFASKAEKVGQKLTSVGKTMSTAITAPLTAISGASVKTAMSFEAAMSNVEAISGATGDDLKALENKAKEMGEATSKSATDSANALSYMSLAGWDTQQMLTGLEPILRLSEAGNADLATTSDLVTDSMSAMGIETQNLSRYLDVVAKTQNSANTTANMMLEAYIGCGGMFRDWQTPIEESAALLGVLANRGIKSSEAGTSMNSILVNLIGTTKKTSEALKVMGITAYDSNGNFRGVETILKDCAKAMNTMTDAQKDSVSAALGGKTQMDTFKALISGINGEYDTLKQKITDSDGALNKMAETMQNNTQGNLTKFKSKLEAVGIQIGDILLPSVNKMIDKLSKVLNWFSNLDDGTKKMIITIGSLTAAVGPALIVIGKVATGVSAVVKAGKLLKTALSGIKMASFLNPTTIAITAGIAAVVLLIKNWDWVKEKAGELKDWISEKWNGVKESMSSVLDSIKGYTKEKLSNIKKAYEENGGRIKGVVASTMQGVKEYYGIGYDALNKVTGGRLDKLKNVVKEKVKGAVEYVSTIPGKVSNFFTETKNKIVSKWEETKKAVTQKTKEIVEGIADFFAKLPYRIGYAIGRCIGEVVQFGIKCKVWVANDLPKIIDGVVNWFAKLPGRVGTWLLNTYMKINVWCLNTYNTITTKIKSAVDGAINWFSTLPSRIWQWLSSTYLKLNQWCLDTYNTVTNKISETVNSVVNWFSTLPSRLGTWLSNTITNVGTWAIEMKIKAGEAARNLVNTVVDTVRTLPSRMVSIGRNIISGIWEGIQEKWNWLKNKVSNFCSGFTDGIKDAFEIHSPSRIMRDEIGKYLAQGIGVGFDDEMSNVNLDISKTLTSTVNATGITAKDLQGIKNSTAPQQTVLYVTNNTYLDGKLIATETTKKVISNIDRQQKSRNIGKGR